MANGTSGGAGNAILVIVLIVIIALVVYFVVRAGGTPADGDTGSDLNIDVGDTAY